MIVRRLQNSSLIAFLSLALVSTSCNPPKTTKVDPKAEAARKEAEERDRKAKAGSLDEKVSKPISVTGSLLACVQSDPSGLYAEVSCGIYNSSTSEKLDLEANYKSFEFVLGSNIPNSLTIVTEHLPPSSKFHVVYRITATKAEDIAPSANLVDVTFTGVIPSGETIVAPKAEVALAPPASLHYIRNVRKHASGIYRCIDLYKYLLPFETVKSYECNTRSSAQDWSLSKDKKIVHALGSCLVFNSENEGMPGDCANPSTPTWIITGEEFRMVGTNNCLSESFENEQVLSPLSLVPCDSTKPTQHFITGHH